MECSPEVSVTIDYRKIGAHLRSARKPSLFRRCSLHLFLHMSVNSYGIYYQGDHSPNEAEREARGYSSAWLHHKGRNKHHLEYWIDYSTNKSGMAGMKMPLRYVCEMVCDRVAASRIYLGDRYTDASPWEYYDRSKGHYMLHPETRALLEKLLKMVRDLGQERTFAYMKFLLGCQTDY